ncbi:TIGR00341 family protein [Halapricum hydrolyticum]|uniref:TIGR00341 family protein n=1 Tax=Halapricum hydrolyticum TaxID=2979991 RepID=A0AAE3IDF4_9EURY|nr:TIGR00341 family protein [Halapricum hydrolyticum]MCU4719336.1 TIGR00341 family protein [Halapricum hydrolyticum]MCU4728212.1 TIGR00341 family protein [Halapricum hydrolyticum]
MRLVQVLIPKGTRSAVLDTLDHQGIDYAVFDEVGRGDFEAMVQFPVPPSGVEPVMDELIEAGIREDAYTIVLSTETVVSQRLSALVERFPGLRISREELYARAQDLAPANSTFFAFLLLSTVIATTGLLLDSAATIIGAMVVAPLMGPAVSASVGTILDDPGMTRRGVKLQVVGLVAAIATAAVMGWLLQQTVLIPPGLDIRTIPQIAERTSPNFLSLFLALGSGIAGSLSIMRGSGSTLVGVAIAVALVPPAATSGLGIAFGLPGVAIAGAVLVVVNLLAINVSALTLFWVAGFKPLDAGAFEGVRASIVSRIVVIAVAIALLSIVLGAVTWTTFQTQAFEQQTRTELQQQFDEADIEGVELVSVTADYEPIDLLLGNEPRVNVLVGVPRDQEVPPDLAQRWDDQLTAEFDRDVVVRVGFIETQVSDGRTRERPERLVSPGVSR